MSKGLPMLLVGLFLGALAGSGITLMMSPADRVPSSELVVAGPADEGGGIVQVSTPLAARETGSTMTPELRARLLDIQRRQFAEPGLRKQQAASVDRTEPRLVDDQRNGFIGKGPQL